MTKMLRTHYDNLKVSRDAPQEVIRAAYRALSQQFHPDKNEGDAECERIMSIINTAYEVLSDPIKRQEHDIWISQMENASEQSVTDTNLEEKPEESIKIHFSHKFSRIFNRLPIRWLGLVILLFLSGFLATSEYFHLKSNNTAASTDSQYTKALPVDENLAAEPLLPSNIDTTSRTNTYSDEEKNYSPSSPTPEPIVYTGYLENKPKLQLGGLSTVEIDNSGNSSDVEVKLFYLDSEVPEPVRDFYVRKWDRFTINDIKAGTYDIRYKSLSNNSLLKSVPFTLKEIETYDGTNYSNIKITLYTVSGGNMHMQPISESEFE